MTRDSELQDRFERERSFHDTKYAEDLYPKHYAVSPTVHVYKKMREAMGDVAGKRILEIGCGTGWITCELAMAGAHVIACDISPEAVRQTKAALERCGAADRCSVRVTAIEQLDVEPASIDLSIGFAILHHLDLDAAFRAMKNVIRPGGRLIAGEPLGHNPILNLYRKLTPKFRSADERPLDLAEFCDKYSGQWSIRHQEYFLSALGALGLTYLPAGASLYKTIVPAFHTADAMMLRAFPRLGKFAWYTVLEMTRLPAAS